MFSITNEQDFYRKTKEDLDAYIKNQSNASLGINSLLSMYHLHEWVWALRLKTNYIQLGDTIIRIKSDFISWLEQNMPNFKLIQDLANGSKHCYIAYSTSAVSGYSVEPYGVGPYGSRYLSIDLGENEPERYKSLASILRQTFDFWTEFFETYLS